MRTKVNIEHAYNLHKLNASAIKLDYFNSSLSFIIVMPKNWTGLPALEEQMQNYNLSNVVDQMF